MGLHLLFDGYLWKIGLLRKLKSIQLPSLNGNWIGKVETSNSRDGRPHSVSAVILQHWSRILLWLKTEHSRPRSIATSLRAIDLLNLKLSYQNVNEPNSNAPSTMSMTLAIVFSTVAQ